MGLNLSRFSAYGGGSWKERPPSLLDDIKEGSSCWSGNFGVNSEYKRIKHVVIGDPTLVSIAKANTDPEGYQLLEKVNYVQLVRQKAKYLKLLSDLGITVSQIVQVGNNDEIVHPNIIFARDLFAMTPFGAILSRPATVVRAGEEKGMLEFFVEQDIPVILQIFYGYFEGADFLWAKPDTVLIDTSSRTNLTAFRLIEGICDYAGITTVRVSLDKPGNQHLLGVCNIIDDRLACVRVDKAPPILLSTLKSYNYKVIELYETDEVKYKQAMNLVCVAPREIIMPSDCLATEKLYRDKIEGIKIHKIDVSEIRKMAGGLACMTGIVHRELV